MSVNRFSPEKYHQFTIVGVAGQVVGHIRVKPSSVLWSPKNSKVWYGLLLDRFATLMEENGTRQSK
jgi:hypothetical protein